MVQVENLISLRLNVRIYESLSKKSIGKFISLSECRLHRSGLVFEPSVVLR